MRVRTYRAGEIRDALEQVKQDLGPDAVILSTQRIDDGSGGMGASIVEVTAAVGQPVGKRTGMHFFQRKSPGVPHVKLPEPGPTAQPTMNVELDQIIGPLREEVRTLKQMVTTAGLTPPGAQPVSAFTQRTGTSQRAAPRPQAADAQIGGTRGPSSAVLPAAQPAEPPTLQAPLPDVDGIDPNILMALAQQLGHTTGRQPVESSPTVSAPQVELAAAADLPEAQAPASATMALPASAQHQIGLDAYRIGGRGENFQRSDSSLRRAIVGAGQAGSLARDPMRELELWLTDADLAQVHRTTIMAGVRSRLGPSRPSKDAVERAFIEELIGRVHVRPQQELDERRVVAFVGPTGVGKTTTVAKLAAEYTMEKRRRVGLLTIDTYRIGAVDQLRKYAGLLEIPLEVVVDRSGLERSLRRLENCDMVLIDTIGRSPRDERPVFELQELFDGMPGISYELCISATTALRDMRGILSNYAKLGPDNILFTKLDETFALGPLVSSHIEETLPLSYFTTGQRVPEDIESASVERIIGMILPLE